MKQKTKKSKDHSKDHSRAARPIDFDTPPQADDTPSDVSIDTVSKTEANTEVKLDESGSHETQSDSTEAHSEEQTYSNEQAEQEKVKIDFPFSHVIREKVPRVFEVAETAATQWKNNEKFENLGVDHPVAEIALAKVLEKAKDVERKLDEKGIISAAKMGMKVAKFQAEEILKKFKKNE